LRNILQGSCPHSLVLTGLLLGLLFDPEDGGNTFLRNVGEILLYGVTSQKAVLLRICFLPYLVQLKMKKEDISEK
jgi:hypothetical protein